MPRQIKRLTALKVNSIAKKGLHADGGGLFLQVSASGSKSWIYRYKADGKSHNVITFDEAAAAYVAAQEPGWKNEKHRNQWRSTLKKHASPVLGDKPIADIDTADVLAVLQPIWTKTPETASRVRGRIEAILDWAKAHGYRNGDNPAMARTPSKQYGSHVRISCQIGYPTA